MGRGAVCVLVSGAVQTFAEERLWYTAYVTPLIRAEHRFGPAIPHSIGWISQQRGDFCTYFPTIKMFEAIAPPMANIVAATPMIKLLIFMILLFVFCLLFFRCWAFSLSTKDLGGVFSLKL